MTESEVLQIVPASTVALPISVSEARRQWEDYQRLTRELLDQSDYQVIGGKTFKKKSAWRKLARAFNIADRVTYEQIERAPDGYPLWARIRVEASHPNGRTSEADHECHVGERCCPAAAGGRCPRAGYRGHECCPQGCNGRLHWSHPGDIPATALTRAKNRAIADLIGAGEVSAEEMAGGPEDEERPRGARPARPVPAPVPSPSPAPGGGRTVLELAAELGFERAVVDDLAQEMFGRPGRQLGPQERRELMAEMERRARMRTCTHQNLVATPDGVAICADCGAKA